MTRRTADTAIAGIAGVLGAGSLALFSAFLWTGAMGWFDAGLSDGGTLAWDAGLCLLFFAQHSGMVRRPFRRWLSRWVPVRLHGVLYTIASGVVLVLLVALWQRSAVHLYTLTGVARWIAGAALALLLSGVLWGIRTLGDFDAFGIEALLAPERQRERPTVQLCMRGPYGVVRHPFYCFAIAALWMGPEMTLDRMLLNALFTVWIVLGAKLEERDLAAEFGEQYRLYQHAVPMLVPRWPWLWRR